jgi:hypothetical protein
VQCSCWHRCEILRGTMAAMSGALAVGAALSRRENTDERRVR